VKNNLFICLNNLINMYKKLLIFISFLISLFTIVFGINVDSCITINSYGFYNLTTDVSSTLDDCINIKANNVVLNCNNFSIFNTLAKTTGILITDSKNITIENCKVNNFITIGISIVNSQNVTLLNNNITKNDIGISIDNSNYCNFISNHVFNNSLDFNFKNLLNSYNFNFQNTFLTDNKLIYFNVSLKNYIFKNFNNFLNSAYFSVYVFFHVIFYSFLDE